MAERIAPPAANAADVGIFRNATQTQSPFADFDQAYDAVTTSSLAGGPGSYTVRAGETLSTIAATLWGDASLWYKLAEANGLNGGGSSISAGQTLTIPNTLSNMHNTADTFRPYDADKALGDTQPGTPKPAKNSNKNCGFFGVIARAIVKAIVRAAVTIVLGPLNAIPILGPALNNALTSASSQGWNKLLGLQDRVDWNQVGISAISGAVGGPPSSLPLPDRIILSAVANAITQGISVATGLQDKFSWGQVAASGVAELAGDLADGALGTSDTKLGKLFRKVVKGTAKYVAATAAQSLVDGTDFGDNLLGGMPDLIEGLIGDEISEWIDENVNLPSWGWDDLKGDDNGPVAAPVAGQVVTANDARREEVKAAEEGATDDSQLGDIVVHADLGALAFGASRETQGDLIGPVELGAGLDPETWDGEFGYRSLFDGIQLADAGGRIPGGPVSDVNPRAYFQGSPDGPSLDIKIPSLDVLAKEAISSTQLPPFSWKDVVSPRKWPLVLLVTPSPLGNEVAIPLHGSKIMITHQGDTTSPGWPLKVDDKPIGGAAIETTLPNVFAIMDDSGKPRTIKGANAIVMMSFPDSDKRIGVGVIIRTRREAEIYNEGVAGRWGSNRINAAIDAERAASGAGDGSFRIGDMRRVPGRVFASGKLVKAGKGWLSSGSAAIPKQVLDKLKGQRLNSGSDLTRAIWKAVADTPELAKDLTKGDIWRIRNNLSPRALKEDWYGKQRALVVHHNNEIQHGGAVYDLSNLTIVTPKAHNRLHYGK
jgi:LysM domain